MYNPIRRNRKIGKTQGGRVQNGISYEKWSRIFTRTMWDKLSEAEGKWNVIKENPSSQFYHPCTGDDYVSVLKQLPDNLTKYVKAIVLRRTSKSDERRGVEARKLYHCVIMNAFPKSNEYIWHKKPVKLTINHYNNWCDNWITKNDGSWTLKWNAEQAHRYYLYHVFLHEVGYINQPYYHSLRKRKEYAENFALEWARELGKL